MFRSHPPLSSNGQRRCITAALVAPAPAAAALAVREMPKDSGWVQGRSGPGQDGSKEYSKASVARWQFHSQEMRGGQGTAVPR